MAEMNDIPGNSRKSRESPQTDQKERPPVPVFNGKSGSVKRKSSGFWAWMRRMFLSDRKPKDILREIVEQRVVPGIKDNTRNALMNTIDMFIYPGSGPSAPTSSNSVNYNRIFNAQPKPAEQPRPTTKEEEINKGFSNPCFQTARDARDFLDNCLKAYDYPTLSVHTLYMMRKLHIDYTWDVYGWTQEEIRALDPATCIKHINNPSLPWMIDLPQAHMIS